MRTVVLKAVDGVTYVGKTEHIIGTEQITLKEVSIVEPNKESMKNYISNASDPYLGKIIFNKEQIIWYYMEEK
ncbi:MAG: hypothetical protein N4A62_12845 [Marinisporobacter sp.]|jgi:hypothetical protein|nr:hypothetical protein [Marinisporobacter sp.]